MADSASTATSAANGIGVWRARFGYGGDCCGPVSGVDRRNLAPAARDEIDRRSGWCPRIVTNACSRPKCFDTSCSCRCAVTSRKCGAGAGEPTSNGRRGCSEFLSDSSGGSPAAPNFERTTTGRRNARRFRGRFPGRCSRNLSCERGYCGTAERLRGCTAGYYGSVELAEQKETRCCYIVASPGFDARPNAWNHVRWTADLSFAFGPHQDRRARLWRKSIRSAPTSAGCHRARRDICSSASIWTGLFSLRLAPPWARARR